MTTAVLATLGAIALLLIISAFFSGSETALTAASQPRMHKLAKDGNQRAETVLKLHDDQDRMIGAILLGNNLVNILASALATSVMISAFGETGVFYATAAMTLLVLVFGEILPKTYAFRNSDRMALGIAPVFKVLVLVLAPITDTLSWIIRCVLRPFGIKLESNEEMTAKVEELRGAIERHRGEEVAIAHERAMLRSVLDLSDVDVEMVMRHRTDVVMLDASLPPREIAEQILNSPYTRLPLYRDGPDNIVGVLHAKAILTALYSAGGDFDAIDIGAATIPPWFVPEQTTLLDQLEAFRDRREHFALVVDEYGTLQGIITLEDILEEIVGDIHDEHDEATTTGVRAHRAGSYLINGDVTIRDLNRRFEWDLPDQEAVTIAGLLLHEAKMIPDAGQIFVFHDFRFEVMERVKNQITLIRVTPPEDEEDEEGTG